MTRTEKRAPEGARNSSTIENETLSNASDDTAFRAEADAASIPAGTPKPVSPLTLQLGNIPKRLKKLDRWILWRYTYKPKEKKWTKTPHSPTGGHMIDATNFVNGASFEVAVQALRRNKTRFDGIGFLLGAGLAGVDVDDCREEDGTLNERGQKLSDKLRATYAETSPSGTGFKAIVDISDDPSLAHIGKTTKELEVYSEKRYFCVTGNLLPEHARTVGRMSGVFREIAESIGVNRSSSTDADDRRPASDKSAGSDGSARWVHRTGHTFDEVKAAIFTLSADCSQEVWRERALAMELQFGEDGWPIWLGWSATATGTTRAGAPMYAGQAACRALWDRCRRENDKLAEDAKPVTVASIMKDAREAKGATATATAPASGRLRLYNPLRDPPKRIAYMLGAPVYLPDMAEQVMFYGGSDTFKSSIVQGFCVHMAAGVALDGKAVAPRVVVYAAEETPMLWDNNLHAWTMHFAKTLAPEVYVHAMKHLNDDDYLQRVDGNILGLSEGRARELADLAREQTQRLGSTARPLVVLDPIFEVMIGEENSSTDMRDYIAAGRVIQREVGALVVHVHHTGHSATERERGSSALPASQFARYRLRRQNRLAYELELHCMKHKAGAARTPSSWRVNMIELMPATDDIPEAAHGVVVEYIGDAPIVTKGDVQAEQEADDMLKLVQAYRGDPTTGKPRLMAALGYGSTRVGSLIERAVVRGLLVKGGGAGRAGYSLTDAGRALADRTIGMDVEADDDDLGLV